jgi:hypothetical protein
MKAWSAACRDAGRAVKALFRCPARSIDDLKIKAHFWRSLSRTTGGKNIDLDYMIEDAVHWFSDAVISDLAGC